MSQPQVSAGKNCLAGKGVCVCACACLCWGVRQDVGWGVARRGLCWGVACWGLCRGVACWGLCWGVCWGVAYWGVACWGQQGASESQKQKREAKTTTSTSRSSSATSIVAVTTVEAIDNNSQSLPLNVASWRTTAGHLGSNTNPRRSCREVVWGCGIHWLPQALCLQRREEKSPTQPNPTQHNTTQHNTEKYIQGFCQWKKARTNAWHSLKAPGWIGWLQWSRVALTNAFRSAHIFPFKIVQF